MTVSGFHDVVVGMCVRAADPTWMDGSLLWRSPPGILQNQCERYLLSMLGGLILLYVYNYM